MSEKCLQCKRQCAILIIQKITNGVTTKYVYGLGLIGEEKCGDFKTYHFDYRGSTAAITDSCGNVTDTFEYDTYGNLTGRTGNSFVIFGYNGRDGVVTDKNGLIYMRARYYNPLMHRFINADVVPGEISDAVTLNRYAYANGNPVSNTDPFGLSAERLSSNENSNDSKDNLFDSYGAIYVVDYGKDGLPIVGHAYIYLKGADGQWYFTEYAGKTAKDAKVKIWRVSTDEMLKSLLLQVTELDYGEIDYAYHSTAKIFEMAQYFYFVQSFAIKGDFTKSVDLAYKYQNDNPNYGGYSLLRNNCLDYCQEILRAGTAESSKIEEFIEKNNSVIPREYYEKIKKA